MPYYTADATATYGANYAARSGTLTVPRRQRRRFSDTGTVTAGAAVTEGGCAALTVELSGTASNALEG